MSKLSDTHNIKLTNIEIFVLEYILEDLDVDLELNFKDGTTIHLPKIIVDIVQKLKVAENEWRAYLYCPVRCFMCLPGLPLLEI